MVLVRIVIRDSSQMLKILTRNATIFIPSIEGLFPLIRHLRVFVSFWETERGIFKIRR